MRRVFESRASTLGGLETLAAALLCVSQLYAADARAIECPALDELDLFEVDRRASEIVVGYWTGEKLIVDAYLRGTPRSTAYPSLNDLCGRAAAPLAGQTLVLFLDGRGNPLGSVTHSVVRLPTSPKPPARTRKAAPRRWRKVAPERRGLPLEAVELFDILTRWRTAGTRDQRLGVLVDAVDSPLPLLRRAATGRFQDVRGGGG